MSALPKLQDCPPVPAPDRDLQVLSVSIEGCLISAPFPGDPTDTSAVDTAIWELITRFNYAPASFNGWVRKQGSKHTVAVKVI